MKKLLMIVLLLLSFLFSCSVKEKVVIENKEDLNLNKNENEFEGEVKEILPDGLELELVTGAHDMGWRFRSYSGNADSLELPNTYMGIPIYGNEFCVNISNANENFKQSNKAFINYNNYIEEYNEMYANLDDYKKLKLEIDDPEVITYYEHGYYFKFNDNPYYALIKVDRDTDSLIIHEDCVAIMDISRCNIENVTIPKSVKYLWSRIFYLCPNLKSVVIPENVLYVGPNFAANSGVEEVTVESEYQYLSWSQDWHFDFNKPYIVKYSNDSFTYSKDLSGYHLVFKDNKLFVQKIFCGPSYDRDELIILDEFNGISLDYSKMDFSSGGGSVGNLIIKTGNIETIKLMLIYFWACDYIYFKEEVGLFFPDFKYMSNMTMDIEFPTGLEFNDWDTFISGLSRIKRAGYNNEDKSLIVEDNTYIADGDNQYYYFNTIIYEMNYNTSLVRTSSIGFSYEKYEINKNCKIILKGSFNNNCHFNEIILPEGLICCNESLPCDKCILPSTIKYVRFYEDNINLYTIYENGYYFGTIDNPYYAFMRAVDENVKTVTLHEDCKVVGVGSCFYEKHNIIEEKYTLIKPDNMIVDHDILFDLYPITKIE